MYTFITGRGITAANDPMKAAQNFKDEIIRIWGKEMAQIGIYEKRYPKIFHGKNVFLVKEMDFDFIEMSIDETDERLARLDWSEEKIAELREEMFSSGVYPFDLFKCASAISVWFC